MASSLLVSNAIQLRLRTSRPPVRTRYRIIIMGLPIGSIQFEGPLMSQDDDFLHIKTRSGTMRLAHPM
jgi:hypothetical protein